MALCSVDTCEERLQHARLRVHDLYQVVKTLEKKQVVRDTELKVHLDELSRKFPREVKDEGLGSHDSIDDIEAEFRSGDRESLVNLNMEINQAIRDYQRSECNLKSAIDRAFAKEELCEEIAKGDKAA